MLRPVRPRVLVAVASTACLLLSGCHALCKHSRLARSSGWCGSKSNCNGCGSGSYRGDFCSPSVRCGDAPCVRHYGRRDLRTPDRDDLRNDPQPAGPARAPRSARTMLIEPTPPLPKLQTRFFTGKPTLLQRVRNGLRRVNPFRRREAASCAHCPNRLQPIPQTALPASRQPRQLAESSIDEHRHEDAKNNLGEGEAPNNGALIQRWPHAPAGEHTLDPGDVTQGWGRTADVPPGFQPAYEYPLKPERRWDAFPRPDQGIGHRGPVATPVSTVKDADSGPSLKPSASDGATPPRRFSATPVRNFH